MMISMLGAGAMGSLFGGLLAEQGHEVELLDVDAAHIARIQELGLTLESSGRGERVVRVRIARPEAAAAQPECMIVFTKTMHTSQALEAVGHALRDDTIVLTLQNGLGNVEKLLSCVPLSGIAVGVTTVPADLVGPGHVRSPGHGVVRMTMADGSDSERLATLARMLTDAGLPATIDPEVRGAIWEKVAFNAALNPVCAVTGCTVGDVGASATARGLVHRIADEVLEVAAADGVPVDGVGVHSTLDHALDHHTSHKPSMLQDLLAGRPTEIDSINGEVVRTADRLGVAVPCTQSLEELVRLSEVRAKIVAVDEPVGRRRRTEG